MKRFLILTLFAIAITPVLASPPGGSHNDGDLFIDSFAGRGMDTWDDTSPATGIGACSCVLYRYSGQMHSWGYAPAGTVVTFSAATSSPANLVSSYDDVWYGSSAQDAATIAIPVTTGGYAPATWGGIADLGDKTIIYSADAGSRQLNRAGTIFNGASGGISYTFFHTRFPAGTSHVDIVGPGKGALLGQGDAGKIAFDASLTGAGFGGGTSITQYMATCDVTESGTQYHPVTIQVPLTANGQHFTDITISSAAGMGGSGSGSLAGFQGSSLTVNAQIMSRDGEWNPLNLGWVWSPWQTMQQDNMNIMASSTFSVSN